MGFYLRKWVRKSIRGHRNVKNKDRETGKRDLRRVVGGLMGKGLGWLAGHQARRALGLLHLDNKDREWLIILMHRSLFPPSLFYL